MNQGSNVEQITEEYLTKFEEKFFSICNEELGRVNDFFLGSSSTHFKVFGL